MRSTVDLHLSNSEHVQKTIGSLIWVCKEAGMALPWINEITWEVDFDKQAKWLEENGAVKWINEYEDNNAVAKWINEYEENSVVKWINECDREVIRKDTEEFD